VGEWGLARELQALLKGRLAEHVLTATRERGGEEDEDKKHKEDGRRGSGEQGERRREGLPRFDW